VNKKTYFRYLIGAIALFLSYHLIIWFLFTSKIFGLDEKHSIGDLARMSYQTDMIYKRKLEYTLPKSFLYKEIYNKQPIDIITIGDSFSHGSPGGKNPYYQDYLASKYNLNVLNIDPIDPYDYFSTVVGLYKSGFLKQSHTKYLIIESVERFFPRRFSQDLNISQYKALSPTISGKTFKVRHLDVPIISTANYKLPYYSFLYLFKDNAKKDVYKFELSKNLFTHNINNKILIFHDDIKNIPQFTEENIIKMNKNFNTIAKLLSKLNIKLIILPAPDKYDIYSLYIKKNKYPNNPFFKLIRPLQKEYIFIDTKQILTDKLKQGILDLYYPDDTHWNYKASEAIINQSRFKYLLTDE
jgi:hypothetical protein